jgi:hypothetical protein
MKEIDLNKIWDSDLEKARGHFENLEDPESLARKKSGNILQRIKRNMMAETIAGIVLMAAFCAGFWSWDRIVFWGLLVLAVLTILYSAWLYLRFASQLNRVNQQDVRSALEHYVNLTSRYIRRLKVILYYLTPLGAYVGMSLVLIPELLGEETKMWILAYGLSTLVALPLVLALVWFVNRKYIPWLYGRQLDAFRETLEGLDRNNGD